MTTSVADTDERAAPIRVLQFICPTGFYGAERWITALANNADPALATHALVVTDENGDAELELCVAFEALGLPVHRLAMSHRFDVRAIGRLARLLKRERFDVLHTHGYKSDLIGAAAARMAGVPSVCTPHGFEDTRDLKLRAFVALGKRSFRFFDRVVPLSESLRDDVVALGVPEARVRYIANGVDLEAARSRAASLAPAAANSSGEDAARVRPGKTIGFVGQLIERKNVAHILDVFARLRADGRDVRLLLVGDGDERAMLQRRVNDESLGDRVEFHGFVTDAIPHYADIDVFVMASSLEGIPRCLMEAMALGVPIAAYDIPGVDQLLEHERTGLLAPFGDRDALLAACERLLFDEELARRIAGEARRHVEEHFSARRMAAEYTALYRELPGARV